jgi:O-antigen/teichoic acid export membrane protein
VVTAHASAVSGRRATADMAVQIVGRLLNLVLGIVATVVLVRALGSTNYGQWATILAVTGLADTAGQLALDRVAIPKAAADPEREPEWLGALLSTRLLIGIPATVIAIAIVLAISTDSEMRTTGLVLSVPIAAGALTALSAVFQLRVRNHVNIAVLTLNSVLWTGSVLALNAAGKSMLPFAVAFAGITVISSVIQAYLGFRRATIRIRASRPLWGQLAKMSVPVALYGLAITAYNRVDQLIVFEFGGSRDAGLYGAIYRLLDQGGFLPTAVVTTLMPILAASYATDPAKVRRLLQLAVDNLGVVALGALGFAIAASEPVIRLLYGEDYTAAAPVLPVLALAYLFICWGYCFGAMIVVLNVQRRLIPYAVTALAVNIGLNLIFVPIFGYAAAAWVTVITEALILYLTVRLVGPQIRFRPQFARVGRATLAAAGMTLGVWLLKEAGVPLAGLLAAAVVAYVGLLLLLRALPVGELLTVVRRRGA